MTEYEFTKKTEELIQTQKDRKWDESSKKYTNLWLSFECKTKEPWETGKWNYGEESEWPTKRRILQEFVEIIHISNEFHIWNTNNDSCTLNESLRCHIYSSFDIYLFKCILPIVCSNVIHSWYKLNRRFAAIECIIILDFNKFN